MLFGYAVSEKFIRADKCAMETRSLKVLGTGDRVSLAALGLGGSRSLSSSQGACGIPGGEDPEDLGLACDRMGGGREFRTAAMPVK